MDEATQVGEEPDAADEHSDTFAGGEASNVEEPNLPSLDNDTESLALQSCASGHGTVIVIDHETMNLMKTVSFLGSE